MNQIAELRAFVALSRGATMGHAAAIIGRDAAVLSRRIQSLERRLGVQLVRRNTRKTVLTAEGRAYLERAAPLLAALDALDAEIGERPDMPLSGAIRLTVPTSFGRTWITPLVLQFLQSHPGVTLHVDYSDRRADLIGDGFDLAIRVGAIGETGLTVRQIAPRRRVVCAAPGHAAVTEAAIPAQLARHGALCFAGRERQQWSFVDDTGSAATVTVPCVLSSNNADLLIEAACGGYGILNTTDWHCHRALKEGRLVRLLEGWRQVDAGAVYVVLPAADAPLRVRALADWLTDRLRSALTD